MDEQPLDTSERLVAHVAQLATAATNYLNQQEKARKDALDYYQGKIPDLAPRANRSSVVSQDLRAVVKKLMPSIMRTILGGGDTVKYSPVGPGDEEGAQQATDYVNRVVIPEGDVEKALYDAIHDAAVLKTGILKWQAIQKTVVTIQEYTDQPDEAVVGLLGDNEDPTIEISNYKKTEETDPDVLAMDPNARRHSFRLKRTRRQVTPTIVAVPRGTFLISPGAKSIEAAELVGEVCKFTRSSLVEMGYKKSEVWQITCDDDDDEGDDVAAMGDDYSDIKSETRKALEEVEIYDVVVKVDLDDDGLAEMYRVVYGEGKGGSGKEATYVVLEVTPVSEAPYAELVIERDAHQFEGHSVFEDVKDIQRVNTTILRQTLDNLYATNNPRPTVNLAAVNGEDAMSGAFGQPIYINDGYDAATAVHWQAVPFFADKSFGMLEYMKQEGEDRTGITDRSGGLDPDALQNVAATTAAILSERGVASADMIVKSVARGIRKAFRGLLKLVIAHADEPRTLQIKGEWVSYDPKVWNVDMDCMVNIGLGGGTKERDMAVLQVIYSLQKELLLSMGPDNPFVKPEQLYNVLEKLTETAGFPSAAPYFTKPDPQEVAQKLQEAKSAPNPEMMKVQAQMQLEQAKLQQQAQIEQMKSQAAQAKEAAQMQADLQVRAAEAHRSSIGRQEELQAKAALEEQKLAFEREKLALEERIKAAELAQQRELELLKLGARDGESGIVSQEDSRMTQTIEAFKAMLAEMSGAMNRPKRVVRDANGDVVGVEAI